MQGGREKSPDVVDADHQIQKSIVLVGSPWPEGIEVQIEPEPEARQRLKLVWFLALFFGVLLLGFTIYGMCLGNSQILLAVFQLTLSAISGICGWALGRSP